MKKLFLLFVFLFLLLFSGSQNTYANTQKLSNTSHSLEKKFDAKFKKQGLGDSVIENINLDNDEDFGDDIQDDTSTKLFTEKYNLLDNWYFTFCGQLLLNQFQKNFKIFTPFCGQSNPIYITLRVLRI